MPKALKPRLIWTEPFRGRSYTHAGAFPLVVKRQRNGDWFIAEVAGAAFLSGDDYSSIIEAQIAAEDAVRLRFPLAIKILGRKRTP